MPFWKTKEDVFETLHSSAFQTYNYAQAKTGLRVKTPRKPSNAVYAVKRSGNCPDLYIGEAKQPLHRPLFCYFL